MKANVEKVIVMTKKGYACVTLNQGTYSDGSRWYNAVINGVVHTVVGPMALNDIYCQYKRAGWTVKPSNPATEKKADAPSERKQAAKKTREEALTEKYGDKDSRREYKKAEAAFHRFYMLKYAKSFEDHKEYLKVVAEKTDNALKLWEAQGRPAYNC